MKSKKYLRTRSLMWVAAGAVAGLSLGATGLVHAATDGSSDNTVVSAPADSSTDDTSSAPAADIGGGDQGRVSNETPLTGDAADKVTAAAQAAAPGATVDRVETDDSHAYEAHVTLADGSKKVLFFNESFEADGEETAPAGGRGGKGGHGGPQETALTGDAADQVTAAALAAEPGSTVIRVETDDSHAYEAHVTLADGTEKILFFNESFQADGSEVPPAGGRGGKGDMDGTRRVRGRRRRPSARGGRGDHAHDENGNDIPADQAPPADSTAPSSTTNG